MSSHRVLWRGISRLLVVALILANAFQPLAAHGAPSVARGDTFPEAPGKTAPTPLPNSTKPRPLTATEPSHLEPAKEKLKIAASSALPNATILASFTAPAPNGDRYGRAIASDGTYLYITYSVIHNSSTGVDSADPYVYQVSRNGRLHRTFNVGVTLGAMAWDPTRNLFWATNYQGSPGTIYTFDPSTGTLATRFSYVVPGGNCSHQSPGFYDGLAYDPSTDSLWISDDTGNVVFNLTTTGSLRSFFPFDQTGYTCQTGIAVQTFDSGSPILWLVDIFNNAIVPTDLNGNLLQGAFFAASTSYVESILYDTSSFHGKCVIWENNANQTPTIIAYHVSCARPGSATVGPIAEQSPGGTDQNAPSLFSLYAGFGVNTRTSGFTYVHTDLAIPGRGPSLAFIRAYNSTATQSGDFPFSVGWTHNYNIRIRLPQAGGSDVDLIGPLGRSDHYTFSNGAYLPPPGVSTSLVQNADNSWTATLSDQTTWTFNRIGNLTAITDRYGNRSALTYNVYDQLASIGDPGGRGSLTLSYDSTGELTSVADWTNRTVTYGYGCSPSSLLTVTDRSGKQTSFSYMDDPNYPPSPFYCIVTPYLQTVKDANNNTLVRNTYTQTGFVTYRVSGQTDALGNQTTFSSVTNPDNTTTTTVTYPTNAFDGTNPTVTDTYDASGHISQRVTRASSASGDTITQGYTFDANGFPRTLTDGRGNTTTYCYDVDYTGAPIVGSRGNLTRRIDPMPPGAANQPVTLLKYDARNNLIEAVSPNGVSGGTSVSCATDLTTTVNPSFATDFGYDANGVDLLSVTQKFTDPEAGLQTAVTKYEYGDANNPGMITKVILPRGNTGPSPDYSYATNYSYGTGTQAGMLVQRVDPLGNTTTYSYDAVGRLLSLVAPNGNASGGNPADHTWSFTYDNEDRLLTAQAPAPVSGGAPLVTQHQYDPVGNRTVVIDANGQVTRYLYDAREKLSEVDQSPNPWTDPNATPNPKIATTYTYDNLGNLSRITRAQGDASYERATDYTYDGLDRLRAEIQYPGWPSTSPTLVTVYSYDAASNLATLTDPLGKTTTYGYDPLNRLISISYVDGTPNVAYAYDNDGNRVQMTDGTGTTTYTPDELGQITTVVAPNGTVQYRYDLDGNRVKLIYPDSTQVTYSFDKADRLASLTDWSNRTISYSYRPDSLVQAVTKLALTTASYSYDNAVRLTQVANVLNSNEATISQHSYTLDAVGNRTQVSELIPAALGPPGQTTPISTSYGYDRLYRLTVVNATPTYTYDPVGNRLSDQSTSYSYDRADRITAAGSIPYTVDAAGNLTARGADSFSYDQANRLTSATVEGQLTTYAYDGDGNRVSKTVGTNPTIHYVNDVTAPLSQILTDGTRKYVYGLGLEYAVDSSGTVAVYQTDGLESTRVITDGSGNVVQAYQTDAFGNPTQTLGSLDQPFRFTGQLRDTETGFYDLRARMYDPATGRFTSRDPLAGVLGNPPSLNRYAYAGNNPVTGTDPSGLWDLRGLIRRHVEWFARLFWDPGLAEDMIQRRELWQTAGAAAAMQDEARAQQVAGLVTGPATVRDLADNFQPLPRGQRPSTVALLETPSGASFQGRSGFRDPIHPDVTQVLNELGNANDYNRRCAEVHCISEAFYAFGENAPAELNGGTISTARVRGLQSTTGLHGTPIEPCNVCRALLDRFGVRYAP